MAAPERYIQGRDKLAATLRRLRTDAGLTGVQAARLTGMSQPKISKIENGRLVPSAEDVEALLILYKAGHELRDELVDLVTGLHATLENARIIRSRGAAGYQDKIRQIEADSTTVRTYQIALIPGLLQTAAYAKAIFSGGIDPLPDEDAAQAVAARQQRQLALYESGKQFDFIVTEAALRARVAPAPVMRAQLHHLATLAELDSVRLSVIPWTVQLPDVPLHGFHIYDDRLVIVGLASTTAYFTDPREVAQHLKTFAAMETAACFGEEAHDVMARIEREML